MVIEIFIAFTAIIFKLLFCHLAMTI